MEESARIARGKIADIKELKANDYDCLFVPGGFGAAKNLSNYAVNGVNMEVDPEVERVFKDFHSSNKYFGLMCISPILATKVFGTKNGGKGITFTFGSNKEQWPYAEAISVGKKLGNRHK
jgi:enhancing lycopene biosynthesis protein 2